MTDATQTTTTQAADAQQSTSAATGASDASKSSTTSAAQTTDSFVKPAASADTTATAKPARPEWLPENLWDAEKGAKADDIKAALTDADTFRATRAALPKTAAEYQATLPEGVKLPDGASIDAADPRFKALQDVAHAEGWSQKAFSKALGIEINRVMAHHAAIQQAIVARDTALGANGTARVDTLHQQIDGLFDGKKASDLKRMLVTHDSVEAFESIFSKLGSQGVDPARRAGGTGASDKPGKIEGYKDMTMAQKLLAGGHV